VKVLGINALYHDPAAALVVDGKVVAAAEEERFSRRKHGKRPLPWSAWELPELSAAWVLTQAGLTPADLDAVAYSFDPRLMPSPEATVSTTRATSCGGCTPRRRRPSSPTTCRG
jgi:carbamoyltransferase